MNITYLQQFFRCAYDNSCYLDCLIKLACRINGKEQTASEVGRLIDLAVDRRFVDINQKDYMDYGRAFLVLDPAGFLTAATGRKFTFRKENASYRVKANELEILFYAKSSADGQKGIGHFVLPDHDPLKTSQTVKSGFVYSKRVFRMM